MKHIILVASDIFEDSVALKHHVLILVVVEQHVQFLVMPSHLQH